MVIKAESGKWAHSTMYCPYLFVCVFLHSMHITWCQASCYEGQSTHATASQQYTFYSSYIPFQPRDRKVWRSHLNSLCNIHREFCWLYGELTHRLTVLALGACVGSMQRIKNYKSYLKLPSCLYVITERIPIKTSPFSQLIHNCWNGNFDCGLKSCFLFLLVYFVS